MGATRRWPRPRGCRGRARLGCEAKRILVDIGSGLGPCTDAGILRCDRIVVASGPRTRFLLRTARNRSTDLVVAGLAHGDGSGRPAARRTRSSRRFGRCRKRWARSSRSPRSAQVAAGEAEEPSLVSLLLGGRSAGQCLIGTSLGRSLTEEAEGADTVRRLAERAARVSPHLRDVPVVAAWSGRRAMSPDGLPVVGPVPGLEGLEVASGVLVDRDDDHSGRLQAACRGVADPGAPPGRFA